MRLNLLDDQGYDVKTPKIYPAKGGGFHAMYKPVDPNWTIQYRRYQNGALSTPVTLHTETFLGGSNDICQAGNGDIWITWENWMTGNEQIWAACSPDGGASWNKYDVTQYFYASGEDGQAKNPNIAPFGPDDSPSVIACSWKPNSKGRGDLWYGTFDGQY